MRKIDLRARLRVRTKVPDVSDHADDFAHIRIFGIAEIQALADRLFTRPEASCHRLADDHDPWGLLPICRCKTATFENRNFHRAEIVRTDRAIISDKKVSRCQRWTLIDAEADTPPMSGKRQIVRDCRRFDAGQRFNAFEKALVKLGSLLLFGILRFRQRQTHRENILRLKPQPHLAKTPKAFNHQACADQQHQREGNL